jgi:hypothetical protein
MISHESMLVRQRKSERSPANAGCLPAAHIIIRPSSNRPAIEQGAQPLQNLGAKVGGALEIVPRAFYRE